VAVSDDLTYVLGDPAYDAADHAGATPVARQFFDNAKLTTWRQFLHVTMDLLGIVRSTLQPAVRETFANMTETAWAQIVSITLGWDSALRLHSTLAPVREWLLQVRQ
jgi:hypothetical protein